MQAKSALRVKNRELILSMSFALGLPFVSLADEYTDIQNLDEAELLEKLGQLQVLDEIVVTATAREESLQDVPISVIATPGEDIQAFTLTNVADVTTNLPAITVAANPIGNFIFIRGIGTPGANQGIEQSVSIFHDGVYMGRNQLSRTPFMDLERVEVLRGPQSIFFGKNSIGGAIHAISAKPTDEFEGSASLLFGTDEEIEATTVFSGPLSDGVLGRLSLRHYELGGYLENVLTENDAPEREDTSIRAQLEFNVGDDIEVNTKWEHHDFFSGEKGVQLSIINPTGTRGDLFNGINQFLIAEALGVPFDQSLNDRVASINDGGVLLGTIPVGAPPAGILPGVGFAGLDLPGFPDLEEKSDNESDVVSIDVSWFKGEHTIKSLSAYATYNYQDICDCDFSALPLIQADADEDYEQWSQEFRILSPEDQLVEYVAGFYYQEADLVFNSRESIGSSLAYPLFVPLGVTSPQQIPNLARDYQFRQDQRTWSVFGSATWNISNTNRLTLGLRYIDEEKRADHVLVRRLTDGWDFGAFSATPIYGDTPQDYLDFLAAEGVALGDLGFFTENIFTDLLGTTSHDIRDRLRKEENLDWSINFEQDLGEDTLLFATVATGTKGGGFDARYLGDSADSLGSFEYEEEKAINYELGVKLSALDNTLTLNATAFFTEVEDYQVSIFDGATAFLVDNAAEIESKGLEVDVEWLATERLKVSFAGSLLDAEFKEFTNAPCWTPLNGDPNRGGCVADQRDASGDDNLFSPNTAANLTLDYLAPLTGNIDWRATLNTNFVDEHFVTADLDPIYARQPSYSTVDLRLAIENFDEGWEVALIGKNLTDEEISVNSNDQPLVPGNGYAQLQRLRSFAIQAIKRFE